MKATIHSQFISRSLVETCTVEDFLKPEKVTSTFPFDPTIVLLSTFVHVPIEEENEVMRKKHKNNLININGMIITELDFLDKLNQYIKKKKHLNDLGHICVYHEVNHIHLCNDLKKDSYYDAQFFLENRINLYHIIHLLFSLDLFIICTLFNYN